MSHIFSSINPYCNKDTCNLNELSFKFLTQKQKAELVNKKKPKSLFKKKKKKDGHETDCTREAPITILLDIPISLFF